MEDIVLGLIDVMRDLTRTMSQTEMLIKKHLDDPIIDMAFVSSCASIRERLCKHEATLRERMRE